jgi:hypothetical protein
MQSFRLLIVFCSCFFLAYVQSYSILRPSALKYTAYNKQVRSLHFSSNTNDENLDNLKLDTSTLSKSEQERLAFIQRLSNEADDMIRVAGMSIDGSSRSDDNEIERAIFDTKWSGQSDMEIVRQSNRNPSDILSRIPLYVGDIVMLLIFAAIGRGNHNEGLDILALLGTAAPFIISWTVTSSFLGAYTREATASQGNIAGGLLPAWAVSVTGALAVRGFIKGYIPPTPFIIVSLVSTLVLLYLWRTVYIAAFGNTSDEEYRKAGFLEVFKMISTLIRRW